MNRSRIISLIGGAVLGAVLVFGGIAFSQTTKTVDQRVAELETRVTDIETDDTLAQIVAMLDNRTDELSTAQKALIDRAVDQEDRIRTLEAHEHEYDHSLDHIPVLSTSVTATKADHPDPHLKRVIDGVYAEVGGYRITVTAKRIVKEGESFYAQADLYIEAHDHGATSTLSHRMVLTHTGNNEGTGTYDFSVNRPIRIGDTLHGARLNPGELRIFVDGIPGYDHFESWTVKVERTW